MRILIVEDEFLIAKAMRQAFEKNGYDAVIADTGEAALGLVDTWKPDIVLLDIMLPDMRGEEVAQKIRDGSAVPIIMVTSLGAEADRLTGFEVGADDYVVKPFSMAELQARVDAVLRRTRGAEDRPRQLVHRELVMDVDEWTVSKAGEPVQLSKREFEILRMLMESPGQLVTRTDIARSIWGLPTSEATKTMDVHMSWLRQKLGDSPRDPEYIETVRGVGFRLIGDGA